MTLTWIALLWCERESLFLVVNVQGNTEKIFTDQVEKRPSCGVDWVLHLLSLMPTHTRTHTLIVSHNGAALILLAKRWCFLIRKRKSDRTSSMLKLDFPPEKKTIQ